eukprot:1709483-Pyramimonas_sp.AAC.1
MDLETDSASMVRVTFTAQATHLKYVVQLSGCQRPCVEFAQNNNRVIAVLQVVGCCECFR